MSSTVPETSVRHGIDVDVPPAHAFEVFTAQFDTWWNPDHHLLPASLHGVTIEPFVGGRIMEEAVDGATCVWGRVVTWEPDRVFAFTWLIGPDWQVPTQDQVGSRVTVTFSPTANGTHVELFHDYLEVHGPGWRQLRAQVDGTNGWPSLVRRFADLVTR